MNEIRYIPLQEAEFNSMTTDSPETGVNPLHNLLIAMFLASIITLAGWSSFQHVAANSSYGTPWRMVVLPNEAGATFQFYHSASARYSPKFQVNREYTQIYDVKFYNSRCEVPDVVVEDICLDSFPGSVCLRIGDDRALLTKKGIDFNGEFFNWADYPKEEIVAQSNE